MSKTSNVFVRVEPDLKTQAEQILDDLGLPMAGAINLFLKQIVINKGLPFAVKLPPQKPISVGSLNDEQLYEELMSGYKDVSSGKTISLEELQNRMKRDYGI
ncbi:MAG: type II toxin-antitoxin system RelB/DinJ family antitoxin [Alphaproteobacteria bacterium]|nr:type II toxin-antitoxin system RelB/DinJ family antitoxin [Alphaproteobacteria bacterium]